MNQALTSAPEQSVPFLREERRRRRRWRRRRWLTRGRPHRAESARGAKRARQELLGLHELAVPLLRAALEYPLPEDWRKSLHQLLQQVESCATQRRCVRGLRAIEVLAHIDTPPAPGRPHRSRRRMPEALLTYAAKELHRVADQIAVVVGSP